MKRVLSWGLGLQSTMLAVMSALGDIEPLDLIITADLGFERRSTYEIRDFYIDWLHRHGQSVVVINSGDIRLEGASEHIHIPFFTETGAPLRRQCTREFKIRPIRRYIREWLGYPPSTPPHPPAGSVEQWIGFTIDEWSRIKTSGVKFIKNRFPLIERKITRNECPQYFIDRGLPVPGKSACLCCPYRSASEWKEIAEKEPENFQAAIKFDEKNRNNPLADCGSDADKLFIWRDAIPLQEVDLQAASERERKSNSTQLPLLVPDACDSGYCFI